MHVQLHTKRAKLIWGFFTTLSFITCFLVIFRVDCLNQNQAGASKRGGGNNCLVISKLVPTALLTPHYDRSRLASTAFSFLFVIWFFRGLWTWRSLCFCVKVVYPQFRCFFHVYVYPQWENSQGTLKMQIGNSGEHLNTIPTGRVANIQAGGSILCQLACIQASK